MYNNINTQSYSVPWEGESVKQCLSSWYPEIWIYKPYVKLMKQIMVYYSDSTQYYILFHQAY